MSKYLRISSLLNDSNETDEGSGSPSSGGTSSTCQSPVSNCPSSEEKLQSQSTSANKTCSGTSKTLPTSPTPPTAPSAPATHHSTRSRESSGHVVRAQPIYTVFDYRYWPYTPHAYPVHPAMLSSSENSQQPLDLSATAAATGAKTGAAGTSSDSADQRTNVYPPPFAYQGSAPSSAIVYAMQTSPDGAGSYVELRQGFYPWLRQRRTRACQNCHAKKVKCEGNSSRCFNCVRTNSECKWVPMKKRGPKPKAKLSESDLSATFTVPIDNAPINDTLDSACSVDLPTNSVATVPVPVPVPVHVSVPRQTKPVDFLQQNIPEINSEIMRRFYSDEVSEETRESVTFYFDYYYAICPIFHPATFIKRVVNGEVDQLLIDSMRASAARAITKKTGRKVDVDMIISCVQERMLLGLDSPSMDYVRAVVVIASLFGGECKFITYNSLSCLAGSLVSRLGWHTIDLDNSDSTDMGWDDWLALELKRRTFWVVYENDSYQSMLSDRQMTVSEMRLFVSAPGSNHTWDDISMPQISQWPTRFDKNMSKEEILRRGWLLHTFIESCSFTALISRVNNILWDIKIGLFSTTASHRYVPNTKYLKLQPLMTPQTDEPITSLFQYTEFAEVHRLIFQWRDNLIRSEDMKHLWQPNIHFSRFGCLEHRLFMMRIRYFCLYTYAVPILHCLHFSNRPSYFRPRAGQSSDSTVASPESEKSTDVAIEDKIIREILESAFADRLNDGLLAYDIVEESWIICVDIVHDLIEFLNRNDDIPLDRCDQTMPFCLLTSITVMIRQIRMCRKKILEAENKNCHSSLLCQIKSELSKSGSALRFLWNRLQALGFMWRVDGIEHLLRTMQIEEVANAADLFSNMAL
ncbi:hypothetical protein J3B02_001088 [Coemansia erecta]|nr:hypothetical protein J3B02_001088 [Coemansia erecta]KAJ2888656.1 hypothetical protein FB639_000494 [Coemansia asiatica]